MLPLSILEKCISILEERKLKYEEELAAEAEKCQGIFNFLYTQYHPLEFSEEAEGYTSLCGDSDNMYEEIQGESKFDGLRSIKELLLRVRTTLLLFLFQHFLFLGTQEGSSKANKARQGLCRG